jgi:hypothetical protein
MPRTLTPEEQERREPFAETASRRGDLILYHPGETNRCPRCGRQQWYVGRTTAECGFCFTALVLASETAVAA